MYQILRVTPTLVLACVINLFICSCAPTGARPLVLIASPPSGTLVETNSEVLIQAVATDVSGVARIELWANGVLVAVDSNLSYTAGNFSTVLHWTPRLAGNYAVEAKAVSRTGETSSPASITLVVQDGVARPTATPLPTLTATRTLTPSPTLLPSITPSLTPSIAPPTLTATPGISPSPTITVTTPTLTPTATATATLSPTIPASIPSPTGLSGTPTGQTTIDLAWTDNANDEEGFRVYRNLSGTNALVGQRAAKVGTGNTTHSLTGLTCSETYALSIKTYKGNVESAASNVVNVATDPCTPTEVAVSNHTGQTLTVTWNDTSATPEETGFKVYVGTTLQKTVPAHPGTGAFSATLTGLDCGTTYSDIRVTAINNERESPKSANAASETTLPCQVKVEFTRVDIKDDASPWYKPGLIRITFTTDAQTQVWPSATGSKSIYAGFHEDLSVVYSATKPRTSPLNISVHAQNVDTPSADMGTLLVNYPGALPTNFGAGAKTLENNFFKIYFTITVTSPP